MAVKRHLLSPLTVGMLAGAAVGAVAMGMSRQPGRALRQAKAKTKKAASNVVTGIEEVLGH